MQEKQVAPAGSFCWNEACPDSGQVGKGNMRKSGRTDKGRERDQGKPCKKTWTETQGTLFYRCGHSEQTIVECLAMLGDRNSLAAVHRVKGVKEETVSQWVERAATHVEQIEERLAGPCKLSRVQLDALWTYVGHKGEKGGGRKKSTEARFGVEPPLAWTAVCGWDVP